MKLTNCIISSVLLAFSSASSAWIFDYSKCYHLTEGEMVAILAKQNVCFKVETNKLIIVNELPHSAMLATDTAHELNMLRYGEHLPSYDNEFYLSVNKNASVKLQNDLLIVSALEFLDFSIDSLQKEQHQQ